MIPVHERGEKRGHKRSVEEVSSPREKLKIDYVLGMLPDEHKKLGV